MSADEYDISVALQDFFECIEFFLSESFIQKWKFRFSERFLVEFQKKLIEAFQKRKPLKRTKLIQHMQKKGGWSVEVFEEFFKAIDADLLYPALLKA